MKPKHIFGSAQVIKRLLVLKGFGGTMGPHQIPRILMVKRGTNEYQSGCGPQRQTMVFSNACVSHWSHRVSNGTSGT
jgi:hypothetical protein